MPSLCRRRVNSIGPKRPQETHRNSAIITRRIRPSRKRRTAVQNPSAVGHRRAGHRNVAGQSSKRPAGGDRTAWDAGCTMKHNAGVPIKSNAVHPNSRSDPSRPPVAQPSRRENDNSYADDDGLGVHRPRQRGGHAAKEIGVRAHGCVGRGGRPAHLYPNRRKLHPFPPVSNADCRRKFIVGNGRCAMPPFLRVDDWNW